jgi:small conductance mechanosensitive channel
MWKISSSQILLLIRVITYSIGGALIMRAIIRFLNKKKSSFASLHQYLLVEKIVYYCGTVLIGTLVLHEFGFNLSALLGTVGIVGLALGVASQTVITNIISGLFLLMEKTVAVGDLIQAGSLKGRVVSIDLLAIKIVTETNSTIRISNHELLSNPFINFSVSSSIKVFLCVSVETTVPLSEAEQAIVHVATKVLSKHKFSTFTLKMSEIVFIPPSNRSTALFQLVFESTLNTKDLIVDALIKELYIVQNSLGSVLSVYEKK